MRRLAVLGAVAAICLVAVGCGDDSDSGNDSNSSDGGGQLFVQLAGGGTLQQTGEAHTFNLQLNDLDKHVTVFTDRPVRKAGTESVDEFVSQWDARGFEKDPPNAALQLADAPGDSDAKVFEISNPRADSDGSSIVFTARDLGDRVSTALSDVTATPDSELPRRFGRAVLFIDPSGEAGFPKQAVFAMNVTGAEDGDISIDLGPTQEILLADFESLQTIAASSVSATLDNSGSAIDLECQGNEGCGVRAKLTVISSQPGVSGNLDVTSGSPAVTATVDKKPNPPKPLKAGSFTLP